MSDEIRSEHDLWKEDYCIYKCEKRTETCVVYKCLETFSFKDYEAGHKSRDEEVEKVRKVCHDKVEDAIIKMNLAKEEPQGLATENKNLYNGMQSNKAEMIKRQIEINKLKAEVEKYKAIAADYENTYVQIEGVNNLFQKYITDKLIVDSDQYTELKTENKKLKEDVKQAMDLMFQQKPPCTDWNKGLRILREIIKDGE